MWLASQAGWNTQKWYWGNLKIWQILSRTPYCQYYCGVRVRIGSTNTNQSNIDLIFMDVMMCWCGEDGLTWVDAAWTTMQTQEPLEAHKTCMRQSLTVTESPWLNSIKMIEFNQPSERYFAIMLRRSLLRVSTCTSRLLVLRPSGLPSGPRLMGSSLRFAEVLRQFCHHCQWVSCCSTYYKMFQHSFSIFFLVI